MDDPSALLQRIPELESLARASPRVARALAAGDPHAVYRAVWWAKGSLSAHAEAVRTVLAHRRAFLKPIKSAPTMATLNGVGARVYGSGDHDPQDGTYIGTHYLTVVFVPVVPLAEYLVSSDGTNYRFYGKVPLSAVSYVWRTALSAALGLGMVGAAGAAVYREAHASLRIANGFDFPVHVKIGELEVDVPPQEVVERGTGVGSFKVVASVDGRTIEELNLTQGPGEDQSVYSILGAAPVVDYDTIYSEHPSEADSASANERYQCGESVRVYDAPYFFTDPPSSQSVSSGGSVRRRTVTLGGGGWSYCVNNGVPQTRARLAGRLIEAFPDDAAIVEFATTGLRAGGDKLTVETLRAAHTAHPASVPLARMFQDALGDSGLTDELNAAFPPVGPDASADAAYLYLRGQPSGPSLEARRALFQAHPESEPAKRSLLFALAMTGHWEAVEALLPAAGSPEDDVASRARALVGRGKVEEAEAVLKQTPGTEVIAKVAQEALSRRLGHPPEPVPVDFSELGEAAPSPADVVELRDRLGALLGDPPHPKRKGEGILAPAVRGAMEVEVLLHSDPAAALAKAKGKAGGAIRSKLNQTEVALLVSEAVRTGADEFIEAVVQEGGLYPVTQPALQFLRGDRAAGAPDTSDLAVRAALELGRSRMPDVSSVERARLVSLALEDELLGNIIHDAVARWPSPGGEPSADGAVP